MKIRNQLLLSTLVLTGVLTPSCKTASVNPQPLPPVETVQAPAQTPLGGKRAMPRAVIYRTNGDYNENVAVGYDRTTGTFITFPAPSDVSVASEPIRLIDGWLLDCRGGISENTAFLKWTYRQYHELKSTPSIEELRQAIIPDARVTRVETLDITNIAAQADTARVNRIIRDSGWTQE